MSDKIIKPNLVHNDELVILILKYSFLTMLCFIAVKSVVPFICLEAQLKDVLPTKVAHALWNTSNAIGGLIWWSIPLLLTMPMNFEKIQYDDGFYHKRLFIFFTILITLWITIIPVDLISHVICVHKYSQFPERAKSVVSAIDKFIDKNGTPPSKLGDLVPDYLPSIPDLGTPMSLGYSYFSIHNDPGHQLDKSQYELSIDMDHDYCLACPFHIPSFTYRKGRKNVDNSLFPGNWQYFWEYLD